MRKARRTPFNVAALGAATLFSALVPAVAPAQQAEVPSVSIAPADTGRSDPHEGGWFFADIAPGSTARLVAKITNPADVPQRIRLYLRDLVFSKEGSPSVKEGEQTDVGGWGRFDQPEVIVPAKQTLESSFSVTPPRGADPGDHLGAVVAESQPQGGTLKVVKRVATRLYITIPGDVKRAFKIDSIRSELASSFWPSRATVTVRLTNTGRIRLHPVVVAKNSPAKGPKVLLSRSSEIYLALVRVPWYGGPVGLPVEAVDADSGLVHRVNASRFVIPWGLLVIVIFAGVLGWAGRRWWIKRASRMEQLRGDIRRLEALVAHRPTGPVPGGALAEEEEDEVGAILAALKRARRTESQPSLERLALALHETGSDALDVLLEALEKAGPERREALIDAAASYGPATLIAQSRMERLPGEMAAAITIRASKTGPETAADSQRVSGTRKARGVSGKRKARGVSGKRKARGVSGKRKARGVSGKRKARSQQGATGTTGKTPPRAKRKPPAAKHKPSRKPRRK